MMILCFPVFQSGDEKEQIASDQRSLVQRLQKQLLRDDGCIDQQIAIEIVRGQSKNELLGRVCENVTWPRCKC